MTNTLSDRGNVKHLNYSMILALAIAGSAKAADPVVSGLQPGRHPGPYSFLVATGPQRGQQTCYICETGEKPAVIVFSRVPTEPLGKLLVKCDEWIAGQPKDSVQGWLTILGEKTINLDELAKWGKSKGLKSLPLGVFDDPAGPPSYKLDGQAEVTVILYVRRKVVANFAFRRDELNDDAIKKIVQSLAGLIEKK